MKNIFIGDSILAQSDFLNNRKNVKNLAVPGNKIIDLFPLVVPLKRLQPENVFIHVGINDYLLKLGFFDITIDTSYIDSYHYFLTLLTKALPKTTIYVTSILPVNYINSIKSVKEINKDLKQINQSLTKLVTTLGLNFIDLYPSFLSGTATILNPSLSTDGIHLNKQGYTLFVRIIEAFIEEL